MASVCESCSQPVCVSLPRGRAGLVRREAPLHAPLGEEEDAQRAAHVTPRTDVAAMQWSGPVVTHTHREHCGAAGSAPEPLPCLPACLPQRGDVVCGKQPLWGCLSHSRGIEAVEKALGKQTC